MTIPSKTRIFFAIYFGLPFSLTQILSSPVRAMDEKQLKWVATEIVRTKCNLNSSSDSIELSTLADGNETTFDDPEQCKAYKKGLKLLLNRKNKKFATELVQNWLHKNPQLNIEDRLEGTEALVRTQLGALGEFSWNHKASSILELLACIEKSQPSWEDECRNREGEAFLSEPKAFTPRHGCTLEDQDIAIGLIQNCTRLVMRISNVLHFGQGGYKSAYAAYLYRPWKKVCVLKLQKNYAELKPNQKKHVDREVQFFRDLIGRDFVGLPEVFHADRIRLIMKKYENDVWHIRKALDKAIWIRAGSQLTQGLKTLHEKGLAHNDIKGGNAFLSDSFDASRVTAVYSDFGMTYSPLKRCLLGKEMPSHGTRRFGSPEQFDGWTHPKSCEHSAAQALKGDVFSHAGVIYQMKFHHAPPWTKDFTCDRVEKNSKLILRGANLKTCMPQYIKRLQHGDPWDQLLARALSIDPKTRPSIQEFQEQYETLAKTESEPKKK